MNTKILVSVAIAFFAVSVTAEAQYEGAATAVNSLTTNTGIRYEDVLVVKTEDDGLTFRHSKGIAKIPFTKLSANLQDLYGYIAEEAKPITKPKSIQVSKPASSMPFVLTFTFYRLAPVSQLPCPQYLTPHRGRAFAVADFLRASGLSHRHYRRYRF